MILGHVDREGGKLLRIITHPEESHDHPGEVEIRLLGEDHCGSHVRHVEQRAYFSEHEIRDILEALVRERNGETAS